MNLYALDIPDDETAVPEWLERQIVGVHLVELAAQLKILHAQPPVASDDVRRLLGPQLQQVLDRGLADLSRETIGRLLQQPEYLLQLQELLVVEGGEHWRRRALEDESIRRHMADGQRRVLVAIGPKEERQPLSRTETTTASAGASPASLMAWYRQPAVIAFAVAACVVLGFFAFRPVTTTGIWTDQDLQHDIAAAPYHERLATSAEQWFDERPAARFEVRSRLAALRERCSALIAADHSALTPDDRNWLIERCQAWAGKFDEQLANLDRGADPLQVRTAVDEDVRRLVGALRSRAELLKSA